MFHLAITRYFSVGAAAALFAIVFYAANSNITKAQSSSDPAITIQALLSNDATEQRASARELAQLQNVYAERNFQPIWSGTIEALESARVAKAFLARAGEHGLNPDDYSGAIGSTLRDDTAERSAEIDVELTRNVLRYARDVRSGRLEPSAVYRDIDLPREAFDPAAAFATAVRQGEIVNRFSALPPPRAEYQRLVAALAKYRRIEALGGWPSIPGNPEIKTDGSDPRLRALMHRLQVEDPAAALPDADPVAAVKRYQERNGLTVDGLVGALTLEVLNVSAAERIAQIAANMERWRWLPRTFESRYIAVNVPDQTLKLIDSEKVLLSTRVIVGRPQTPTPIFRASVIAVTANPPWNVPHSIAVQEILPLLRRNANYLATQNMILLNGPADDPSGVQINWLQISADRFPYQIQQRPGDKNALGKLKLELPNRFSVFLHDTPGRAAFERDQRALSHGCIRVQQILPLAALAIGGDTGVAQANISALIAAGTSAQISLHDPLPVYVLYWTAIPEEDGSVGFRRDLYGRDRRLSAALLQRITALRPIAEMEGCSYDG